MIHATPHRFHDSQSRDSQYHDKSAAIVAGILGGVIGHAASNNQHKCLDKLNPKSIFVLMTR